MVVNIKFMMKSCIYTYTLYHVKECNVCNVSLNAYYLQLLYIKSFIAILV